MTTRMRVDSVKIPCWGRGGEGVWHRIPEEGVAGRQRRLPRCGNAEMRGIDMKKTFLVFSFSFRFNSFLNFGK